MKLITLYFPVKALFVRPLLKIIVIVCLLLPVASYLKAQTNDNGSIKGSVSDAQHAPVVNATVLLKNTTDSAIYKIILTDGNGVFVVPGIKPGNYYIEINMISYEKKIIRDIRIDSSITERDLGVQILGATSKTLGEVVVKGQTPFIERQLDKTVVNVENSIVGAGTTVLELLDKLPGVQVSQNGQISLNGKSFVNVYLDGKATQVSSEDLANMLRGMSSHNIQKIEIMARPSAKFDAGGSGGVINIVRKKNRSEGVNGSVNGSLGQGSYTRYNGGFNLNYKHKKYNLFLTGAYIHHKYFFGREILSDILNRDYSLNTRQASISNTINTNNTFTPQVGADFYLSDRTTLSVSGTASIQKSNVGVDANTDFFSADLKKMERMDFISTTKSRQNNYNGSVSVVHQMDTLGKEISASFDYGNYGSLPDQYITNTLYDADNHFSREENSLLDGNRQLNIYAGKADYTQPLGRKGTLDIGWKSSYIRSVNNNLFYNITGGHQQLDSAQSDYTLNTENINALYINFSKEFKKLTIQAGLRGEHTNTSVEQTYVKEKIKRDYVQLFPSFFADYKINDKHALNLKIVRRTDRPSYADMIPFRRPLTATTYFKGNPNLVPKVTLANELTYSYRNALFITLAYEHASNFITTLPFLDDNNETVTRMPSNINKSETLELDIVYSKKLTDWWTTNNTLVMYNQSFKGTVRNYTVDIGGTPTFFFNTTNSFFISSRLSAELGFRYVHDRYFVMDWTDGYYTLNAGLKYQVLDRRGTLTLNGANILRSEDHASIDSYPNLIQNWYLRFDTRVVSLNFTYRFGRGKAASMRVRSAAEDEKSRTRVTN